MPALTELGSWAQWLQEGRLSKGKVLGRGTFGTVSALSRSLVVKVVRCEKDSKSQAAAVGNEASFPYNQPKILFLSVVAVLSC